VAETIRWKHRRAGDVQVLDAMDAAVAVDDAALGVGAHSRGAHVVGDESGTAFKGEFRRHQSHAAGATAAPFTGQRLQQPVAAFAVTVEYVPVDAQARN